MSYDGPPIVFALIANNEELPQERIQQEADINYHEPYKGNAIMKEMKAFTSKQLAYLAVVVFFLPVRSLELTSSAACLLLLSALFISRHRIFLSELLLLLLFSSTPTSLFLYFTSDIVTYDAVILFNGVSAFVTFSGAMWAWNLIARADITATRWRLIILVAGILCAYGVAAGAPLLFIQVYFGQASGINHKVFGILFLSAIFLILPAIFLRKRFSSSKIGSR